MPEILSPKTVLALLFIAVSLEIAALLIYMQIDTLVNVDLYSYGLEFNKIWIVEYWFDYRMAVAFLFCAPIAMALNLIPYHLYTVENTKATRWGCVLFPLISAGLLAASIYFTLQVDHVVNSTLYNFSLQPNPEWHTKYLFIARTTLTLTGASTIIALVMSTVTGIITRD